MTVVTGIANSIENRLINTINQHDCVKVVYGSLENIHITQIYRLYEILIYNNTHFRYIVA